MERFLKPGDLDNAGWSDYVIVMRGRPLKSEESDWIARDNKHLGFKLKYNAFKRLEIFNGVDDGIYQFKYKEKVVYVGKTDSTGKDSLRKRIWKYCCNGSQNKVAIDEALEKPRAIIEVRVLPEPSFDQARQICQTYKAIPALSAVAMEDVYLKGKGKELYDWND